MSENTSKSIAAGFVAATELIRLGFELRDALKSNPTMTEAERQALVAKTQAEARSTVDEWNEAGAGSE